jgi:cellulose 1,4-beta-cellobiosidase
MNCFTGNLWDTTSCPSTDAGAKNCAKVCSLEGATYEETYGITTEGSSLELSFVTTSLLTNIGSRTYLMNSDSKYEMFYLKNKEFTFTVDVSKLPCGLNGALYFVEMDEDGGMSKYPTNEAGAKYGTGYCDAQCPHDIKFINGEANTISWVPSETDPNSGNGYYGSCCFELDLWEANAISQAYTPHTCSAVGQVRCSGTSCGDIDDTNPDSRYEGMCDKDGCDLNPYRYGNTMFYGNGSAFTVDTSKPMTVVTQFITIDGTDDGDLAEIKRIYIQDNVVINSPPITIPRTLGQYETFTGITDEFCVASREYFNESHNGFSDHGGMKAMGESMARGQVLVMSLWDDHYAEMLWLDSSYPTTVDAASHPGTARGSCPTTSGQPTDVETNSPNSTVTFSNIKFGAIGTTFLMQ